VDPFSAFSGHLWDCKSDISLQPYKKGFMLSEESLSLQEAYESFVWLQSICPICKSQRCPEKQKMDPRAWIGFLVGYEATNIWRIWNPKTRKG